MIYLLKRLQSLVVAFQQKQEGDELTEYALVFLLSSIILLSTLHLLSDKIDSILALATRF